jgi:diacylglycerol kinase family enzyme
MAGGPLIRRQPVLFINPRSGDGKTARAGVAERARAKGIEAVILAPGQNLAALARGTRPTLGGGQLGIVVLDAPGDGPRVPGRAWSAPRLEVNAPAPVHAGVDGEAVDLSPPLRFAIRPAALRVRISPRHPGASPSARLHLPGHPPA